MLYIYKWYIKSTGEIFYVGKGCKDRYKNTKRNKIFNKILAENDCESSIIQYFETDQEALEAEHNLIIELKAKGLCKANLDYGGVGGYQFVWTEEMRKYQSEHNIMKRPEQRKRMSDTNPMKNKEYAIKAGIKHRKPVIVNGVLYESVKVCHNAFPEADMCHWLKTGYHKKYGYIRYADKPQKITPIRTNDDIWGTPIIYKGITYPSRLAVIREYGDKAASWLKYGFDNTGEPIRRVGDTKEYIFNPRNYRGFKSPCIFDGIYYNNIQECADAVGLCYETVRIKLNKNLPNFRYINPKPSRTKSGNSSAEGSTTNR